jgi:hypothetical protein
MSPILTGVIASGISGNLTPPWSPQGGYDSLATVMLSTTTTTVTFSGIPVGYKHLQLRFLTRTNASGSVSWQSMRFNDSTSNYNNHILQGSGSAALSAYENLGDRINFGETAGNGAGSGIFGTQIIDILDYASTNKAKTIRVLEGYELNGSGGILLRSGLWHATPTPITSITVGPQNFGGVAYLTNSTFALYGVR